MHTTILAVVHGYTKELEIEPPFSLWGLLLGFAYTPESSYDRIVVVLITTYRSMRTIVFFP